MIITEYGHWLVVRQSRRRRIYRVTLVATVSRTLRDPVRASSARLERRLPVQNRPSAHRAQEAVVSCTYGGFMPGVCVTPGYVGR